MMRRILLATAFLAFVATPALAQVQECAAYIDLINTVVDGPDDAERQRAITSLTDIVATPRCFARFLISRASPDGKSVFRRFLARFEGERSDKQEGATAAGSGSTTVVAQGATARVRRGKSTTMRTDRHRRYIRLTDPALTTRREQCYPAQGPMACPQARI